VNKVKSILYRFFSGRYGTDKFQYFLLVLYAVFCILNAFLLIDGLQILTVILFVYIFWRMMSRNFAKRRRENEIYLKVCAEVKIGAKLLFDRVRYIKTARFRRCPHCKAITKLPVNRGKHKVRCPKCSCLFDVHIY